MPEDGIEAAITVAELFRLINDEAQTWVGQVSDAISRWRDIAAKLGLARNEIERMGTAFEPAGDARFHKSS
jgi:hypothetical protein